MDKFKTIYQRAIERKGGEENLRYWLPAAPPSPAELSEVADDRFLSAMSRCIFQAGFVWRVIDNKWPGFETVFLGFVPEKIVLLSPEQLEAIGKDTRIVRNMQKILSVVRNAQYVLDRAREHGSYARFVAQWPQEDLVGLFAELKKHGDRLGGMSGPRMLRMMGKDTFILTSDVVMCLQQAGLDIKATPSSQAEMRQIQQAFNQWQWETGLSFNHLSRICACSVGENYLKTPGEEQ